ncbi:acyl carrier protein [Paenibacillus sp. FJAT-26967]|uniref:acyl carrier protein n=1 Tax=Paenibacillus sp. FJAT-26967 TaxID=1729690 RepID=UPI0008392AA7|nr:phosphopantetheine-binding protein [Paenibacillus sp. FJAT-26967]
MYDICVEKLQSIYSVTLKLPMHQLTADVNVFSQLGADSLDMLTLAFELEQAFGVIIDDGDLEHLYTLSGAMQLLESKRQSLSHE